MSFIQHNTLLISVVRILRHALNPDYMHDLYIIEQYIKLSVIKCTYDSLKKEKKKKPVFKQRYATNNWMFGTPIYNFAA